LSEAKGELNRIGQPTLDGGGESDSIHDKFYGGLGGVCLKFDDLCFLTDAQKALFFQASGVGVGQRCKKDEVTVFPFSKNLIDDLLGGKREEGLSCFRIVWGSVSGKEDAKMIMNFGGGSQSGASRSSSLALFDGEGGGEAFDRIDVDGRKLGEVMPGMGG
jgi:hypothetical protein